MPAAPEGTLPCPGGAQTTRPVGGSFADGRAVREAVTHRPARLDMAEAARGAPPPVATTGPRFLPPVPRAGGRPAVLVPSGPPPSGPNASDRCTLRALPSAR